MAEEKTPPAEKADDATEEQLAAVLSDNPEAGEDAFDEHFDEFAKKDETDAADATTAPPIEDDVDKAAAPAETAGKPDEEPAPAAAGESTKKDIWADATPEQKAAFEAADHENASHRTRASAQNRKITELMAASKPAAEPAAAPAADPAATKETDEKWAQFKEDYPEVAGPLADRMDRQDKEIAGLRGENENLRGQVTGITDAQAQASTNTEEAMLEQRHPEWEKLTASEEFVAWLPDQPRYVQEGFVRNGNTIIDGQEAADLMDLFTNSQEPAAQTPEAGAKPATDTNNGKATRRQRRLESAVSTEPGQAGPGAGPPEGDFDAAFDHFARQP